MLTASLILVLIYLGLILWFYSGFEKSNSFVLADKTPQNTFSIIIPFRNESQNLHLLIKSLNALKYPQSHFEIIFVDDDSNDDSRQIILNVLTTSKQGTIKIIDNDRQSQSPKKDAITTGIKHASFDFIITTDADCEVPPYWLDAFDELIQSKKARMIAGPVAIANKNTFLSRFQIIEFLSLQAASIGAFGMKNPIMCNGANLCYEKRLFFEVNGFENNNHLASGDDMFMLENANRVNRDQVHFLKCDKAIVITQPLNSWTGLISQHQRWAAKSASYNSWLAKFTGIAVFLMNLWCVALIPMLILNVIPLKTGLSIVLIKFSIDFLLVFKSSRFFAQEETLFSFISASIVYPFFSIVVALKAIFQTFDWKGRKFKK